ncbi:alkaline phosphatase-like isoform X2 [Pecten maximus]|uniref:alkaline phosphatase-like isoform X2 n=1 Tax=Pecten maximus TaxID=6579 RepID=UPI0014581044|nr:alkaline phosphatase-like isoform X2 [Pecten maximus]
MDNWTQHLVIFLALCVFVDCTDWKKLAQQELNKALNRKPNTNKARNVILFVGDGMGVSTVTAARILRGQTRGAPGEETVLEFENFPNIGLSKTYSNDRQTTGSASTATALLCGEKTNYRLIGLNDRAVAKNCPSQVGNEIPCAFDWFRKDGRSVGAVTTSRITHATPACAYAKSAERDWEGDTKMKAMGVTGGCIDIAAQLVYNNSFAKVMLGGGRRYFLPMNHLDPERSKDVNGYNAKLQRLDGIDLTQVWKEKHKDFKAEYVWNKSQFDAIDASKTDYILGLFEAGHMQHELDRDNGTNGEPSLAEMTRKAIEVLKKDENGFFLLVEEGRIDHAHHDNNAKRALYSVLALEDAIKVATEMTDESDTLIMVTADHSHVFNIAGYPERGNDIFGVVNNVGEKYLADKDYLQVAAAPRSSETHGGEDVAIYARGPMSHLIHGVHEQHYIAHVMTYAACVANNKYRCDNIPRADHNGAFCSTYSVIHILAGYLLIKLKLICM